MKYFAIKQEKLKTVLNFEPPKTTAIHDIIDLNLMSS